MVYGEEAEGGCVESPAGPGEGVSKEEGGACSKAATKNTNAISGHRRKVKAC